MRVFAALFMAMAVFTACDDDDDNGIIDPGPDPEPEEFVWEADLVGTEGFEELTGDATVNWTEDETQFSAAINLAGDEPEAVRLWGVRSGTCEEGGAVVGDPEQYPELTVGEDGTATATATVDGAPNPDADYHATVHIEEEDEEGEVTETILACGDLVVVEGTTG